jgi:hypothetical protein
VGTGALAATAFGGPPTLMAIPTHELQLVNAITENLYQFEIRVNQSQSNMYFNDEVPA